MDEDRLYGGDDGEAVLTISTWLWGDKYNIEDVRKLVAGLRRNIKQPFRFALFAGEPWIGHSPEWVDIFYRIQDPELTQIRGCFARLRMFDPDWQREYWPKDCDRLACVDLDTVITGPLDPLFDRPEPFVILRGANSANPNPLNGSLMMLRAGAHPEVWADFSIEKASKTKFYEFPDDQGWIWDKIPYASGWKVGSESGVYAFQKPGWPGARESRALGMRRPDDLPPGARMVVFPGWRSPQQFRHLPWVKQNWAA